MSEIFNFLKKTESERRKALLEAGEPVEVRVPQPMEEARAETANEPAVAGPLSTAEPVPTVEPIPTDIEACGAGEFDLSAADHRIKSILDPLTLVGEQFRLLRFKLGQMQRQGKIRTVLITSAVPEEGKTFMACGLAGVIAQEPGKRVVLIDADMRKKKSGFGLGLYGASQITGLSQVLRGEAGFHESLLHSTKLEFYFLPSGSLPSNPTELLSSPNLEQTIRTAGESFDWVIVDAPPVIALADATLIAPLCDAVILVVQANSTPTKLVSEAVQRIGREKICGVVLNRLKHVHSSRYYYHYYHASSKRRQE